MAERGEWDFPNHATPIGSATYYAVRFSPSAQRDQVARLIAWYGLIRSVAIAPPDPGVARLKLDWWREEVTHLGDGRVRHPLTGKLRQAGLDTSAERAMLAVIDATEDEIRDPALRDTAAFTAACSRTRGSLFELFGRLDTTLTYDASACRSAGGYCAAVERVRRFAELPRRLPQDLAPAKLASMTADERRSRLEALLSASAGGTTAVHGSLPDPARRLWALAKAMHRKLRATGYPVANTVLDRAPIARLWTAWRGR